MFFFKTMTYFFPCIVYYYKISNFLFLSDLKNFVHAFIEKFKCEKSRW